MRTYIEVSARETMHLFTAFERQERTRQLIRERLGLLGEQVGEPWVPECGDVLRVPCEFPDDPSWIL